MSRRWLSMRGVSGFAREVAQEGEPAGSFAIGAAGGDGSMFSFLQVRRSFCALFPPRARVSLWISGEQKKEKPHYEMKPAARTGPAASLVPRPSMASHRIAIGARPRAPARLSGAGLSVSLPKGEPETAVQSLSHFV